MTCFLAGLAVPFAVPAGAQRLTIPLDGVWAISDGIEPNSPPAVFGHTVAVPGLVHSAKPSFADVDHYESREFVWTMIRDGVLPATEKFDSPGRTRQRRTYFWYQRTFRAPPRKQRAVLVVNKAQFGTAVWLNGKKIGEHLGCFTPGRFDVTDALQWRGENRLLIRIGAHPGALPESAFFGTDGEKEFWTPGIYDKVSLVLSDSPAIENVQVAPRIQTSEIEIETELYNTGSARSVTLTQQVKAWKGGRQVGSRVVKRISLAAGERKLVRQTVPVPGAVLWSPDNPFLYVLDTATDGDSSSTRFGMREFHFEKGRAVLNGQIIYLRGSSITLHRFFADPNSGTLPWDEAWLRKFLVDIPKRMHWNTFRICIGPAPQRWLDLADEAGLLLQYEFPIWDDRKPPRNLLWKEDEILAQYKEFVRDNWNHPSLALWDASNETNWPFLKEKVVPAIRQLDLSNRPWENGYNGPDAPGDPFEIHPYKFIRLHFVRRSESFAMTDLEKADPAKLVEGKPQWPGHATIINEYDWLWLHRDGTPTPLTRKVYDHILGPNSTAAQRFASYAYLLAGLTEYWRAFRKHAGVLYLAYLDGDGPHVFTCDNFRDVRTLEFQPHFEDYMQEAFKPLGVYIHFWQPKIEAKARRTFRIMMVNDTGQRRTGKLTLMLESSSGGKQVARAGSEFDVPALGEANYDLELAVPDVQGEFLLKAAADTGKGITLSRRKVTIAAAPR